MPRRSSKKFTKRAGSRAFNKVLSFCSDFSGGAILSVRVIPRARKTEIAGVRAGALLVRLSAPPVEGAANDALIDLLAERLGVARRDVRIVSGDRTRQKRVSIAGVSAADAVRALAPTT
jgi:uncharacterized protein